MQTEFERLKKLYLQEKDKPLMEYWRNVFVRMLEEKSIIELEKSKRENHDRVLYSYRVWDDQ